MKWLIAYDEWICGEIKNALDWLNEWLSISQKVVEKALIAGYCLGNLMMISGIVVKKRDMMIWFLVGILIFMVKWLLRLHRYPTATRTALGHTRDILIARIGWQFILIWTFNPTTNYWVIDFGDVLRTATVVVFLYVFSVNSDGERGRRRKMALAKLKELFSWLPDPVPEGA